MKDTVGMNWSNITTWRACPVCETSFKIYEGPVVALLRDGDWFPLCDNCAGHFNQGIALLAVRDRFNESLSADTRDLDNIGRPLGD